jgi:hypothetical protein
VVTALPNPAPEIPGRRVGGIVPGPDRPLRIEPCELPPGIVRVEWPPPPRRTPPVERALAVVCLVLALVSLAQAWRVRRLTDALRRCERAVVERPAMVERGRPVG